MAQTTWNCPHTLILDGAMATELEARGHDISCSLWSAKLLIEQKLDAIKNVHRDYLKAGCDIITTVSYQASILGFKQYGAGDAEAFQLLRDSARVGVEARDEYWQQASDEEKTNRLYPLVAGSIGPYGAFLHDGSEYNPNYLAEKAIQIPDLIQFHRPRIEALVMEKVDLLLLETMPCVEEVEPILKIIKNMNLDKVNVIVSYSVCESVEKCLEIAQEFDFVVGIGINCLNLLKVSDILLRMQQTLHSKGLWNSEKRTLRLVCYPNSGESWNATERKWENPFNIDLHECLANHYEEWTRAGASVIGGCCRTTPKDIEKLNEKRKNSNIKSQK